MDKFAEEPKKDNLTEEQKKARIKELWDELKSLQASLRRSDWHAAFEQILLMEIYKYGDKVRLDVEHVLGDEPPRADFIILISDDAALCEKAIFRIFRRFNVLEYKNPYDSLNERVLRKAVSYANGYIANAVHDGDVPPDQVTVSIFRHVRPEILDALAVKEAVKNDVPSIYHIQGYTDLPFQVVVTSELPGDEYAAYRALTDKAKGEDIEKIITDAEQETDEYLRKRIKNLLNFISDKNPETVERVKEANQKMKTTLMDILKDEIDEKVNQATDAVKKQTEQQTEQQTTLDNLKSIMKNLHLTAQQAMDSMNVNKNRDWYYEQLGVNPKTVV